MYTLELSFYPITGKPHNFKVIVKGSSGEEHDEPKLPFLDGEIPNVVDRRSTIVRVLELTQFDKGSFKDENERAWMQRVKILSQKENDFQAGYLATIGRELYQVLGNKIQPIIETAVAETKKNNTWLHIRLTFFADTPQFVRLTDYPWELLHNSYDFVARQRVVFSRYIAYSSPSPNLPIADRLNVLLISSGASDKSNDLQPLPSLEQDAIAQILQQSQNGDQGLIQLEILTPPTWDALETRLKKPQNQAVLHAIHFDGHGFFGKRCNKLGCGKAYKQNINHCKCGQQLEDPQGYLLFEKSDGSADYVSAKQLGNLLGNLEQRVALVVLSACRSGLSLLSENVFNGVAQKLIGQGIPAVVAMTYSVSVGAAKAFSVDFYKSLQQKRPLPIALQEGQNAMNIEDNQWYRPVLYLRWQDNEGGQLFSDSPVRKLNQGEKDDNTQDLLKELRKLNEPKNGEISRNIQRAYRGCYSGKDWTYKKTDDIAEILADVNNIPQGSLQYPRVHYFVVCLAAYLQYSNINCGDLRSWAEKNINNFSQELNYKIKNIEENETKKKSSLLIAIAKNTQKSTLSKNLEYTAKVWFIEDITSYQYTDPVGCEPILLSEYDENCFAIGEIDKVLNKCIENINNYNWSNLIIEIFLPAEQLNRPVHLCEFKKQEPLIGQNYEVVVRYYERTQRNFNRLYKNNWENKWKILQNSCPSIDSAFYLADENNVDKLNAEELKKPNILGLKVIKQAKNIDDFFNLILQTGIPVALWLKDNPLDLEVCKSEIEQMLSDCIHKLPENVRHNRGKAKKDSETDIGNHLFLLWDDPHRLPPDCPLS